jgi:hypothetical protein
VIWQRISAHRAPASPNTVRCVRPRQHDRMAIVPPVIIREPEASWWEAQAELGAATGGTMTVAAIHERDAHTDDVVVRLAELAADGDLLVVLGSGSGIEPAGHAVIDGLRGRLPAHDVVGVQLQHRGDDLDRKAAALAWLLAAGRLPVAVTVPAAMHDVTAQLASYVRADRVLRVFRTTTGADLYQVWGRRPEPCVN